MQRFILVRVAQSIMALLLLSMIIFGLVRLTGDPRDIMLPLEVTQEARQEFGKTWGLDRPFPVQYGIFLANLVKGDLGKSIRTTKPVTELIAERLPNSVKLAGFSMVAAVLLALPLGIVAAVRKGSRVDILARVIAVLGQSLPPFWSALVLMEIFSVRIELLPAQGIGGLDHYILPGITMGWFMVAGMMRLLRSSMLDVLDSEFIKMARIKGVSEGTVVWKHALRNALLPLVTYSGMYFAILIMAAVVVEAVFAWPGMGRLAWEAILWRDFPLAQGVMLVAAALAIGANFLVDIAYAYLDPRIRYS